jgi:hypothetical protein
LSPLDSEREEPEGAFTAVNLDGEENNDQFDDDESVHSQFADEAEDVPEGEQVGEPENPAEDKESDEAMIPLGRKGKESIRAQINQRVVKIQKGSAQAPEGEDEQDAEYAEEANGGKRKVVANIL